MSQKRHWPLTICCLPLAALLFLQVGCSPPEAHDTPEATAAQDEADAAPDAGSAATTDGGASTDGPSTDEGVSTDAAGPTELPKIPLGLPPLDIPQDNPMTAEKVALGKALYFDKRLSKDGTLSCATCHDPEVAWTENRSTSQGIDGQIGGANSPTVINAAYAPTQFWDGRAATLEEQALGPIENPIEMGHDLEVLIPELNEIPEYVEAFQKVFGTKVTSDTLAKAIGAFERTVLSGNSPYDRYMQGDQTAMSESAIHGLELFENSGCDSCHRPPLFSRYRYYNAGVGSNNDPPDAGRMAVTEREADLGKFRVPMLREVANTGPYFHDGSVATLEEAVTMMAAGGIKNDNLSAMMEAVGEAELTEADRQDLVAFLEALSGEFPGAED